MKKGLFIILWAMIAPVFAADFVLHQNNQAQTLEKGKNIQIVNFWATWCVPCRKEMPIMSQWYQSKGKKQGFELIGIALDSQENVAKFLAKTPVAYPIWRYTGANSRAMMQSFGNNVGALPYTVVRAQTCGVQQALLGEVDGEKLNQAIAQVRAKCH